MSPPPKDERIRKWMEKNIAIGATFKTCGVMAKDLNLTPEQIGRILCQKEGELVHVARPRGGSHIYTRLI